MAGIIPAVGMRISRLSALMAMCDHILSDPFSQPLIENKILTNEFAFHSLVFHLRGHN